MRALQTAELTVYVLKNIANPSTWQVSREHFEGGWRIVQTNILLRTCNPQSDWSPSLRFFIYMFIHFHCGRDGSE